MDRAEIVFISDELKSVAKEIANLLRTKALTVHDVHKVLRYLDDAIEYNTVFK